MDCDKRVAFLNIGMLDRQLFPHSWEVVHSGQFDEAEGIRVMPQCLDGLCRCILRHAGVPLGVRPKD